MRLFFEGAVFAAPRVRDPAAAEQAMAQLAAAARDSEDPAVRAAVDAFEAPPLRSLLEGVFSNSPFLTLCALAELPFFVEVLSRGPDDALARISAYLKDHLVRELDEARVMRELRIAKRRVALLVAFADITRYWLLDRVTHALSDFADGALSSAISHLLLRAADAGDLVLADEYFPEDDAGYFALAMGKHGARELNYSSDIDLIVLFDPDKVDYRGRRSVDDLFTRMTQALVKLMQSRTADGYVFRVDLDLRPEPSSTPVALSRGRALSYYARRGQDWERAAMIKARSAAGDVAAGQKFLADLEPFVWRSRMEFLMVYDIRAMKQRINAERGGGKVAFLGHNVKLGRGGIREIEFYAQTHQLIRGGRDKYLRVPRTVEALSTLAEAGAIEEPVADQLTEAYAFLRRLEHRLQMIDDQQTQSLPSSPAGMQRVAAFMGFDELAAFEAAVRHHLERVEAYYGAFFEDLGPSEDSGTAHPALGSLVAAADARWLGAAAELPTNPRARGMLRDLAPRLLRAVTRRPDPEATFERLHALFRRVDDLESLLALLTTNPLLVQLLMDLVAAAPALTEQLAAQPELLEAASAAGFGHRLPGRALRKADALVAVRSAADRGGAAAAWARAQGFQISVRALRQQIDVDEARRAWSDVFESVVAALALAAADPAPPEAAVAITGPAAYGEATARTTGAVLIVASPGTEAAASSLEAALAQELAVALERWARPEVVPLEALPSRAPARVVAGPPGLFDEVKSILRDGPAPAPRSRPHRIVESLAATALGADFDLATAPAALVEVILQATELADLAALRAALEPAPGATPDP